MTPNDTLLEAQTREAIDKKLIAAGWVVQDKKRINLYELLGVGYGKWIPIPASPIINKRDEKWQEWIYLRYFT